jgi:glyoxylase-like metal-dependent hydrolase (beta-lactamase superfamily II)
VTPEIYFRKADLPTRGMCNSILIVGENSVGVVDPSTPEAALEILQEIKALFDKPLRYVFITHHHADHSLGLREYKDLDLTVFCSHRCTKEIVGLIGPKSVVVGVRGISYVLADGVKVEVRPLEDTCHSHYDTFIRFPEQKMICTGDAVANYPRCISTSRTLSAGSRPFGSMKL